MLFFWGIIMIIFNKHSKLIRKEKGVNITVSAREPSEFLVPSHSS